MTRCYQQDLSESFFDLLILFYDTVISKKKGRNEGRRAVRPSAHTTLHRGGMVCVFNMLPEKELPLSSSAAGRWRSASSS
jgi:triphosphoribosyl-dephospho-CoA synthetase